ncbi:hypothetical protein VNI00_009542 [Paramarasmius palmivorus]|uniref:Uncharacterized protein n=1 Tax=Paramarasmius palmivorus TaxID=297713 RepID=A0AAW0CQL9_9AGAR
MSESNRWRTLVVVNPCFQFWRILNTHGVGGWLECLERLVFLSDDDEEERLFFPGLYHVFQNAPKLRSVINNSHFTLIEASLPWSRLTEYQGFGLVPSRDHFHILHRTPNLEQCCLVFQSHYYNMAHGLSLGTPVILRCLKRLTTKWSFYDSGLSAMLRGLRLPALKQLSILGGEYHLFDREFVDLPFLLQSSGCQLEMLELSGSVTNRDGLLEILSSVPTVTYLRLWVMQVPAAIHDIVLVLLNTKEKGRIILPRLNTLEFCLPEPSDFRAVDLAVLTELVRWRWSHLPAESHILRLYIALWTPYVTDERGIRSLPPILETLNEEGLQISIHSCEEGVWER